MPDDGSKENIYFQRNPCIWLLYMYIYIHGGPYVLSQIQTPITHTIMFRFLQYFTDVCTRGTKICLPNFKKIGRLVPKISRTKFEQQKMTLPSWEYAYNTTNMLDDCNHANACR